jgi:hypothetical protein
MWQDVARSERKRSMVKTVFVAHPISGDIKGNIKKVLAICEEIHSEEVIPVVPYLVSLQYLNDEVVEDRELGMAANHECFHRRYVDELWLFGDKISFGMEGEIRLAQELGIPIIPKTEEAKRDLASVILF